MQHNREAVLFSALHCLEYSGQTLLSMDRVSHTVSDSVQAVLASEVVQTAQYYVTHVKTLFGAILLTPDSVLVVPFTHYIRRK